MVSLSIRASVACMIALSVAGISSATPVTLENVAEPLLMQNSNSELDPPPLFKVKNAKTLYEAGYQHGKLAKHLIRGYLTQVWRC